MCCTLWVMADNRDLDYTMLEHYQNELAAADAEVLHLRSYRDAAIRLLVDDGASVTGIAQRLGLSRGRVNQIVHGDRRKSDRQRLREVREEGRRAGHKAAMAQAQRGRVDDSLGFLYGLDREAVAEDLQRFFDGSIPESDMRARLLATKKNLQAGRRRRF